MTSIRQRMKEEARRSRAEAAQASTDPAALLLYELMRRGSVLPSTMEQVLVRVCEGKVEASNAREEELLRQARALYARLPWVGGA